MSVSLFTFLSVHAFLKLMIMDYSSKRSLEDDDSELSDAEFVSIIHFLCTPRQKSIRALEIVLAIFLCFECQFLSFYACYKEYKA